MPSVLDVDVAAVVEHRGAAAVVPGQGGLGENEVQLGQELHVDGQVLDVYKRQSTEWPR